MPINHVLVPRDEARDLYLRIYDDFGTEVPSGADGVHLQLVVDAINERFTAYTDHQNERHQSIVRDDVNGEYDVWQCSETYDYIDRAEAERLFDEAWTPEHGNAMMKVTARAKSSGGKTDPRRAVTDSWKCYCGCGKDRRTKRTLFAPGHDARFASNLVKAVKAGAMSADAAQAEADEVSPAMGRKVKAALERLAASKSGAAGPAESNGGVTKGYVTVNRVRIPAERFEIDGGIRLNINDSADGSGDWLDAEDYDSKTQAYWLKRFHAEVGS